MGDPMKRGEIHWYRFAKPDKKRPFLILTRNSVVDLLGEVTIAPVTGTIREIPSEVFLTEEDGMPKDCAVNCDHIQTVEKGRLGARLTTLSPHRMAQVSRAVRFALDL
jgi:mRNA interferase MazF